MTFEQRQARAIRRASDQRAHALRISGRPGYYTLKSATDAGERYTIAVTRDGGVQCSCKAAEYGNPCWGAVKGEHRMMREWKEAGWTPSGSPRS